MATPVTTSKLIALDSCFLIAICAREPTRCARARAAFDRYCNDGCEFYAPGVLISESLYAFCRKVDDGSLTLAEHSQAVTSLEALMQVIKPPPRGEGALIYPSERIRTGYGCARSADSIYLALVEELTQLGVSEIVAFDGGLKNQAARNAPTVTVNLLPP